MQSTQREQPERDACGQELISRAQKLARDAEHHALLSESLACEADRLMVAGLRLLDSQAPRSSPKLQS